MNNSIPSWTYRYDIDENRDDYIKLINKVFDSGRLLFGEELFELLSPLLLPELLELSSVLSELLELLF